jgi:nucleoporin GLE1
MEIRAILQKSIEDTISPRVAVNGYLPAHLPLPDGTATIPQLTLYLVSLLCKYAIHNYCTNTLTNINAAEPVGIMLMQVFMQDYLWFPVSPSTIHPATSISLFHLMVAKYHASAPQLFGITGRESDAKTRLRWRGARDANERKAYIPETQYYDRLVGLAAGWSSLSLRTFARPRPTPTNPNPNPARPVWPARNFWLSVAHIVNTPAGEIQIGQLVLLKTMLETGLERMVKYWGATAVAVLRRALVELPKEMPRNIAESSTVKAMGILREKWARERRFDLAM